MRSFVVGVAAFLRSYEEGDPKRSRLKGCYWGPQKLRVLDHKTTASELGQPAT